MRVSFDEYQHVIVDQIGFIIDVLATVSETNQMTPLQDTYRLRRPDLTIQVNMCHVGVGNLWFCLGDNGMMRMIALCTFEEVSTITDDNDEYCRDDVDTVDQNDDGDDGDGDGDVSEVYYPHCFLLSVVFAISTYLRINLVMHLSSYLSICASVSCQCACMLCIVYYARARARNYI